MRLREWAFATDSWCTQQGLEGGERNADAAEKDVAIAGGATVVQQYLAAGLLDELDLHVGGERLNAQRPSHAPGAPSEASRGPAGAWPPGRRRLAVMTSVQQLCSDRPVAVMSDPGPLDFGTTGTSVIR